VEKSLSFEKECRLQTQQDFSSVFKSAHANTRIKHRGPYVVYSSSTGCAPRLGLSIAKKVIKHAAKRNRVKRCIREFFRLNRGKMSGDMVVRLKGEPHRYDYEFLTQPLEVLFDKSKQEAPQCEKSS
jgi:ribonuclease P protein component